ncbi:ribonuclease CL2-like [Nothoprocta perdicaria]|uniref:ribonuclease CL2-like n=1 Tax=Nothoprocta perdicaria TaxID=30464 RepID=UPI000E1BAFCF|nr:ribonuclease CL2-like [Nothoprocta perdicaria]
MAGWPLLVLLALAALAPGGCYETRYEKFLRQHLDHPGPAGPPGGRYCSTLLQRRRVNGPGRPCKPVNTFVHAPAAELLALCAPRHGPALRTTAAALDVTACRVTGGSVYHPCAYRAARRHQRVEVACEDGRPVHLSRTL